MTSERLYYIFSALGLVEICKAITNNSPPNSFYKEKKQLDAV